MHTLAVELAPIRVNALHPGIVGDSPYWAGKPAAVLDAVLARTPLGRLVTMDEIVHAAMFLLENGAVNGVNLDGRRRMALLRSGHLERGQNCTR